MDPSATPAPFLVRDCALSAYATGLRAQNLRELRDRLLQVGTESIYYHFWGSRLSSSFEHPEFPNMFAEWVYRSLHDHRLGERLGIIDPMDFQDLEALRQELIEVIEGRLEETEVVAWSDPDDQFYFMHSRMVVFDTPRTIAHPAELAQVLPTLSNSSIFYHFIDARMRMPDLDDFRAWLIGYGDEYLGLVEALSTVDLFFVPLAELRQTLVNVVKAHFSGHPALEAQHE
jgi:hypothetical protein